MSDEQKPDDRAPRPGAGDAARTQQIPRLTRDGKPSEGTRTRTVADALREARQSPASPSSGGGSSANGSTGAAPRRPAGPARPAAGGSPTASRDKAAPGAPRAASPESSPAAPAKKAPARSEPAKKPAEPKAAPAARSGGAPSSSTKSSSTPSSSAKPPAKDAPAAKAAATPPAARTAAKPAAKSERTPTAADYARTTRQGADSTAVIPAVKDDAPASSSPRTAASASPASASSESGRQARLRLTHVEPWSVTRLAFVVSVALMIVSVVAVTIFWVVLDLTGIWDQLNGTVTNVLSDSEGSFDLTDYLGLGRLVGLTLVFSAINVVLMTAIATIAAHLYNLAAQLLGGIEVTFTDS